MTIAVIIICGIVSIYLYVMGLCYLCDLYEVRKQKKRDQEEMRRKEKMWKNMADAEALQRAQMERRRQIAEARKQKTEKIKTEKVRAEEVRKPPSRKTSNVRQARAAHA